MRIGVISDTHGDQLTTLQAVRVFESMRVDRVIHCGDVGGAAIVELFSRWPFHAVAGNMDLVVELRSAMMAAGQHFHDFFAELEWAGVRIAVLHGDDPHLMRRAIEQKFDLICSGHTHVEHSHREGHALCLNPGAIYRTSRPSVATVDLPGLDCTHIPLQ